MLLIGFAVMDGFDLGAALLLPFVARNDIERRMVLNTIGPVWEGNQVWLILGGGAVVRGLAAALCGVLLRLLPRHVPGARGAHPAPGRLHLPQQAAGPRAGGKFWDWTFFVCGLVPSLVFGVAFGNLLLGVPFHFDENLRVAYEGGLLGLLNPWALLCGLVSVAMLAMQGGAWLAFKTEGALARRANCAASWAAVAVIVLFSLAGAWLASGIDGFVIQGAVDPIAPSNPLNKTVVQTAGAWLDNYRVYPIIIAAPALAYLGAALTWLLLRAARPLSAFVASSCAVAGIIATAGLSLFPFLLPSSLDPRSSLTVWDASSSQTTLFIMLVATLIFLPIVILYTGWIFHVLHGPVTAEAIQRDQHTLY